MCEDEICTHVLSKGLESDQVLKIIAPKLQELGFAAEGGKLKGQQIERPVFYGENGFPALQYRIDAYHDSWRCALEVEAGRAILGNAIYRDIVQALVMVNVDFLVLAVPITYRYTANSKKLAMPYYAKTVAVADALYGHTRIKMPYALSIVGY